MIKTTPQRVPKILKSGKNTYKPEMKSAVRLQSLVIKNLLSDDLKDLSLKELEAIAEEREYNKTCDYLERELESLDWNDL